MNLNTSFLPTNSAVTAYQFSDKCNQWHTRIFTPDIMQTPTLIYQRVLASKKSIHIHLRPHKETVWLRILPHVAMYDKGLSDLDTYSIG